MTTRRNGTGVPSVGNVKRPPVYFRFVNRKANKPGYDKGVELRLVSG